MISLFRRIVWIEVWHEYSIHRVEFTVEGSNVHIRLFSHHWPRFDEWGSTSQISGFIDARKLLRNLKSQFVYSTRRPERAPCWLGGGGTARPVTSPRSSEQCGSSAAGLQMPGSQPHRYTPLVRDDLPSESQPQSGFIWGPVRDFLTVTSRAQASGRDRLTHLAIGWSALRLLPWRKQRRRRTARKARSSSGSRAPCAYSHLYSNSGSSTRPRWRVFPPEIIRIILQFLTTDKDTLLACSQAAREFRYPALSCLGRHLTVNTVDRLKQCVQLVAGGAFQHVRSLDLGVNNKRIILEEYWKNYLAVLGAFAGYRTLNRLWLSEVPFNFLRVNQNKNLRETITALGTTVTELGLYGCHFSSYEEMVSLIRSFPLCNLLFVRDCATGEQTAAGNAFAGLPEHRLSIKDLQLSSPSSNDPMIDVSNLIEDAALDVGSLTALVCDVGTSERTQRVAAAVFASPVEQFQVACAESGGFQGRHPPLDDSRNDPNDYLKHLWVTSQRSGP